MPALIWMATPVQHFPTVKGEYDPNELGKQCQPLQAWHNVSCLFPRLFIPRFERTGRKLDP